MRRFIPATAIAVALLAACSETSTEPASSEVNAPPVSYSAGLPGTKVSITSGSCSLINSATGEVRCSYDISNPDQILINIYPEAQMAIDYQCVNSSTGRIQSTGTGYRWVWATIEGITDANPTGTDVQLGSTTLPNSYTGKENKLNTCKGKQKLVITKYSVNHWDVYVDNYYDGQPYEDYAWTCYAVDGMHGCTN